LIDEIYQQDYCSRTDDLAKSRASTVIPKLLAIQEYYRSRGRIFLYVLTPSKVAHIPEEFVDAKKCPSPGSARTGFIPHYVDFLRQSGIIVIDTASLIHSLKGSYDVGLFPQGSSHWNELGAANAVAAIVKEIDRQAGRKIVPGYQFTYKVAAVTHGMDRELADILNVLLPPLGYKTAEVGFKPEADCAEHPARKLRAAIVGSSFMHLPASILISENCLAKLQVYFYLRTGRYGGSPYDREHDGWMDTDVDHLKNTEIMIVEENESFAGNAPYIEDLQHLINAE